MALVTPILKVVDQKNGAGLWNEVPSVADQADNLDEGVGSHDGDTTRVWTSGNGRYVTLSLPNIPLTNGITANMPINKARIAFVGKYTDTAGNPLVEFRIYISGQQATPVVAVSFLNFAIDEWVAEEGGTLGSGLLAPWTDMTVGEWNADRKSVV